MKKRLAAVLAAMMVLTMGTTVFAAPSTTTKTTTPVTQEQAVAKASVNSAACLSDPTIKVEVEAAAPIDITNAQTVAETVVKEITGDKTAKAETLAVVEIEASKIPAGGLDIDISVAGVKAGDNILVLHWNGSIWEQIKPSAVSDGVICVHFNSLSPVAIVKVPEVTTTATTTAAPTSPKTGATAPILAVIAMLSLAGVAVCGRKVKFN